MTAEVTIKGGARLTPHPLRAAVLGEVHARPFTRARDAAPHSAFRLRHHRRGGARPTARRWPISAPSADSNRCRPRAKQHRVALGGATLRWEQHSEFTTYTWELPSRAGMPFHPAGVVAGRADEPACRSRGRCWWRSTCICWPTARRSPSTEQLFDRASLAVAENSDGRRALFATDFQPDPAGFVRILVIDRGLGARARRRAGAAHRRARDLSHAGAARPAGGAAADALDQPHRDAARRSDRRDAAHRQADRQSPPARRTDRARRRAGSRRRGEPVPLRRQPRL